MRRFIAASFAAASLNLAACAGDSHNTPTVRLNLATQRGGGAAALMAPDTTTDGINTLVLESVQMVLREIELKREDDDACDDGTVGDGSGDNTVQRSSDDDDGCEEFEIGPILFDLPLGPGVERTISVEVPAGVYDELEFEIHKPGGDGDQADRDFIAQHPDFRDISIKVTGTWNGAPFTFTSDLTEEQERELVPPLTLDATQTTDLTFFVDVRSWFRGTGGLLIDPATANKGGINESTVEDNIERSIGIFEDNDHDGHDDDGDDDDGGDDDGDEDNSGPN